MAAGITSQRWLARTFVLGSALLAWCSPNPVRADGAFADSLAILLPDSQPHRILASEGDLGLLVSDDDGGSWFWICEDAIGYSPGLYQLGPPGPNQTLYAIAQSGLVVSRDAGCSWQAIGGDLARAGDVFADQDDPNHVYAVIGNDASDGTRPDQVLASNDAAVSFGMPLFTSAAMSITGIESARSDPATIYLAAFDLHAAVPYLVRSRDSGDSWTSLNLSAQLDPQTVALRILAVDPLDARSLYLRASNGVVDVLAVTHDAGDHVEIAQPLSASMSAFLVREDGSTIVAAADGTSWIQHSAGDEFVPWSEAFHIRALAERAGTIYASADLLQDDFAIAATEDGTTWRTLLTFAQIRGILGCGALSSQCEAAWARLRSNSKPSGPLDEPDTSVSTSPQRQARSGCAIVHGQDEAIGPWLMASLACSVQELVRRRWRRSRGRNAHRDADDPETR